jgi:hypothetical protein
MKNEKWKIFPAWIPSWRALRLLAAWRCALKSLAMTNEKYEMMYGK